MLTSHGKHRFEELDSLRGVAAAAVVLHHAYLFWQPLQHTWKDRFDRLPLMPLSAGTEAVLIFFVLSGFVLFLPYSRERRHDTYATFLIKRVCRLYLPYLAALLLTVAADLAFHSNVGSHFSWWQSWHRPVPWAEFRSELLMVVNVRPDEFNPNFWTLVQEMRLSLIFPLIAWAALRLPFLGGMAAGTIICSACFWLAVLPGFGQMQTLAYGGVFLMGAVLAQHLSLLRDRVGRMRGTGQLLVLVLALFLFKAAGLLPARYFNLCTMEPLRALGASTLVVLAVAAPTFREFLHGRALRWLGKVSFSLYLLHAPVLYALASVFWFRTSHHLGLIVVAIGLSLALAEPFYRWVERPSMLLGRELARRYAARFHQPATEPVSVG